MGFSAGRGDVTTGIDLGPRTVETKVTIYWTRIGNTNMIHDKLFSPPSMLGVKFENYVCFHVLHYPEAGLPH